MSKINVNTWEPESSTALTMGATGDTVTVPSGASLVVASGATINITGATQTGFPSSGFTRLHIPATGDYTVPASVSKIVVEVQGGGGGGGGGHYPGGYGSGGSAGAYALKSLSVTAGDVIAVVVGVGGNGYAGGGNGTVGGTSSFTDDGAAFTAVSCTGGGIGKYDADPDAGGVASGGDIQVDGMRGTSASGGNFMGSPSMLGFAGPRLGTTTGAAKASTGYGAGGTGAYSVVNGIGEPGRVGIVIVWEYK